MRWTLAGKLIGDLALVNLGYLVSFLVRYLGNPPRVNWEAYWAVAPWITIIATLLFWGYGLYTPGRRQWEDVFLSLVCSVMLLLLAAVGVSYMLQQYAFPRSIFFLSAPLQLLFLSLWRRFIWAWSMARQGTLGLIVVGPLEQALIRARQLMEDGTGMYQVVGLILDNINSGRNMKLGFPLLGSYEEMAIRLDGVKAGGILFCSDIPHELQMVMLGESLRRGLVAFVVPSMYEILLAQVQLEQLDGIPVFRVNSFTAAPARVWKRLADVVLALVCGVVAFPLVVIAALAIKLESPEDPIFYLQERVGQNRRFFQLIKLRTMRPNAEERSGPVLATVDDPRITSVGRFIRATRIDELPQLWNVLKGEMSFVGPRPERPYFVEQFLQEVPGYDFRHQVKVGITGLAQIEGKYSTSPEDKLRYDLLYANRLSLLRDAQILLHTLKVMLMRGKAS